MKEVLLLKLGEVVLKGLNRRRFESRLIANLRRRVSKVGKCSVYIMQSTIYVEPADGVDMDEVLDAVHNVFGVCSDLPCSGLRKGYGRYLEHGQ